ncbi:MAG: hypothetical protein JXA25_05175 [Anaerolineales bacterium]|nr:hypothetical protein [Anaerolineales bacterium]
MMGKLKKLYFLYNECMKTSSPRQDLAAMGILSACSLAFEIIITRLFALQQFHHFAFLVISLAVLGIGAGGTFLSLFPTLFSSGGAALGFSSGLVLTYAVINFAPFDSYAVVWEPRQAGILLLTLLALSSPFFFYGWIVSSMLDRAGEKAYIPYAVNLGGSSLGCLLAVGSLSLLSEEAAFFLIFSLSLPAAWFLGRTHRISIKLLVLAACFFALVLLVPSGLILQISPYKALSQFRLQPGTSEILQTSDAGSRVNILESPSLHSYPGLSLQYSGELPTQTALFLDGEGPYPITAVDPDSETAGELADSFPGSAAYLLRPDADTLILQPGTGFEVLLAVASGADRITISTPEEQVSDLLLGRFAAATSSLYDRPEVTIVPHSDRGTLQSSQLYDLIIFPLSEPYHPVTSGAFSLSENYTLTVNTMVEALGHLEDQGILVFSRWLGTPPGDSLKTWIMLIQALEETGITQPEFHLIALRSMRTATLLASPTPFTEMDFSTLRAFLNDKGFDPIYFKGVRENELNHFNQLPEDSYHRFFTAALQDSRETTQNYPLNISPADDNQPFFYHFFRWRQTPEVVRSLGKVWQPFGGSGYLVLLLLLGVLVLFSLVLIGIPLGKYRSAGSPVSRSFLLYFALVGAGFMLVEIPLLQQFTLLFDKPSLALSFILFTLLLASGIGSWFVPRLTNNLVLFALPLLLLSAVALPGLIRLLLVRSLFEKVLWSFLVLLPTGFLMGIPFSWGLRYCEHEGSGLIPLVFAINGASSAVSGVLAALLTLDFGITQTLYSGAGAYILAVVLISRAGSFKQARPQGS